MTLAIIDAGQSPFVVLDTGENTAEATRQAGLAIAAKDIAETARDVVLTNGPYYATQAAGEAATTTGQEFAVAPGNGTLTWYRRTAVGSDLIFEGLTKAAGATKTELAAGTVPVAANLAGFPAINKTLGDALPYVNPSEFFGIKSDGATDDTVALAAAITAISNNSRASGGALSMKPGAKTVTGNQTVVRPFVRLNLNGGEIEARLSGGTVAGLVPMSAATIENGKVTVVSSGAPGTQAGAHAPIRVGPDYDGAGTVANPSELTGAHSWVLRRLTLSSDKVVVDASYPLGIGSTAIQIYGDASNGLIERITVPDSTAMSGGILADWIPQGGIVSAPASMTANKTAYLAGTAKTLHARGIDVRFCKIGRLTRPGSDVAANGAWGIRFSGCQFVRTFRCKIAFATSSALFATPGDLGFEFAEDAVRRLGMCGLIFNNIDVLDALVGDAVGGGATGYLLWLDSDADNVRTAIASNGYVNMIDPQVKTDIVVSHLAGRADGGPNVNDGVRLNRLWGAKLDHIVTRGFKRGAYIEQGCRGIHLATSIITESRSHGVVVDHAATPPEDVRIYHNAIHSNGTAGGTTAGVFLGDQKRSKVWGNEFGTRGAYDLYQDWGLRVDGAMTGVEIGVPERNIIHSTTNGGVGESLLSTATSDYGKIAAYKGADVPDAAFVTAKRSGLNLIAEATRTDSDGIKRADYIASETAAPASVPVGGAFVAGETLKSETTGLRKRCTVSGTPGTWAT